MAMPLDTCSFVRTPEIESCLSATVLVTYMYICPVLEWLNKYIPETPTPPLSCKATTTRTHIPIHFMICVIIKMVTLF